MVSVSHDSLVCTLRGLLDDGLDLVVGSWLLQSTRKVDNRDIGSWHSECHTGELSVERWDDLSDSLGCSGGRWDDVVSGSSSSSPVLGGWTIDRLLSGSGSVDSGHQSLDNSELVVDDLGKWGETVSCAGSVRDDLHLWLVLVKVDSADEHWRISRWGRDDDVLGTSLDVSIGLVGGGEDSGGLDDGEDIVLSPRDVGRVSLGVADNLVTIDDQLSAGGVDIARVSSVSGVVLEHVDHVLEVNERVVDGDNLNIFLEESISENTKQVRIGDSSYWLLNKETNIRPIRPNPLIPL